jgi:hypothetical protein
MIAALTILSWCTVSQNSALMLPVVVAVAAGFYALLRGRQQVSSIAAYVEECEGQGTEPSWFTRLARFRTAQGFNPAGDWIAVCLANAVVLLSIVFAWLFAETAWQGELMSGIVTGCRIVFAFHSSPRLPDCPARMPPPRTGARAIPRRVASRSGGRRVTAKRPAVGITKERTAPSVDQGAIRFLAARRPIPPGRARALRARRE